MGVCVFAVSDDGSGCKMADDIDELLDEVESKYINTESSVERCNEIPSAQNVVKKCSSGSNVTEELDAAIDSICSIPEPLNRPSVVPSVVQVNKGAKRRCTVVYVGGNQVSSSSGSVAHRRNPQKRPKLSNSTKVYAKKYFTKPVFELSVKDLEAESARRKQKELIETLFEKKLAVVTDKMILDVRKFKRIKSDVWSNFGDVRLLISESDAKKYNIDHHVIHLGGDEVILCKSFVACVKCSAVFSYESHAYGTSTLRSHLKSCGKPRYNMKEKKVQLLRQKRFHSELLTLSCNQREVSEHEDSKPPFQQKMLKFRDQANKLQDQILLFLITKLRSFNILGNREFKNTLQKFVQIGSIAGEGNIKNFLSSSNQVFDSLLHQMYSTCERAFRNEVADQYGLCFSAEVWTDIVGKISYISLFCHYANANGEYRSVVLFTAEFPYEQRSADDVADLFNECLQFTKIEDCKKLIVVDYSYNMVTAIEKDYPFIQCICYSVSRAVQTVINQLSVTENEDDPFALPGFASLINQCRSLVLHFKQYKLQGSLPKYLVFCPSTCWKSTLNMLQSINNQWDHILDVLNERGELELLAFDQEMLSLVVDFLDIFRDSIEELASTSHPTLNIVIPWLTKWKSHCLQNEDESPFLASLKSHMSSAIDEEVVTRITIYHKLATMLDPRFKELQFLTVEDQAEARVQAINMVAECMNTVSVADGYDNASNIASPKDFHLAELCCNVSAENTGRWSAAHEVESYLSETFVMGKQDLDEENKFNPLKYWVRNKTHYPYLSKVALWLLSCPASAVRGTEPVLTSNWMVSMRESELPSKHMHMCLFIRSFKGL